MTDNAKREERGWQVLRAYKAFHPDLFDSDESAMGDLLTDLHHFCDSYGIDWAERLAFSNECHAEEVQS
jgi:hypothetical protein